MSAPAISASLVKELRKQTGAGMMDCKRALEEAGGDIEAARTLLRERGMASAAQRAGRETTEGVVLHRGMAMIAVGCETEPVAKNDEFRAFAEKVLGTVETQGREALESLDEECQQLIGRLGENVVVVGAERFTPVDGGIVAGYVHTPPKFGTLVQIRGGSGEFARKIAMHVTASAPQWIGREDVPEDVVTAEREIFANSDEVQSKPEQAREKIVEGMLNKRFFAAQVLTDQPWIHDTAKTVAQALADEDVEVLEFERFALAG